MSTTKWYWLKSKGNFAGISFVSVLMNRRATTSQALQAVVTSLETFQKLATFLEGFPPLEEFSEVVDALRASQEVQIESPVALESSIQSVIKVLSLDSQSIYFHADYL